MAAEQEKPVVVIVVLKFASLEDRDECLAAWRPLAEYVRAQEEGTLAYEAVCQDKDAREVVIFERYISKDYMNNVHCASQLFKAFFAGYLAEDAPWRKDHPMELSLQTYNETGFGIMHR